MAEIQLEPGDHVVVPWGLDDVAGTVERLVQRGSRLSADVLVTLPGSDEVESVTFPIDVVERINPEDVDQVSPTGAWLSAFNYQEALHQAVLGIVGQVGHGAVSEGRLVSNFDLTHDRTDIEANLPDGRTLYIEVKKVRRVTQAVVEGAVRQARRWFASASSTSRVAGLIVFSESPDRAVEIYLNDAISDLPNLSSTTWRGDEDNPRLADALISLSPT